MIDWIVRKYDWMIYRLAYYSLRRMCDRDAGFAYLFELCLRDWRLDEGMIPSLKEATERFWEAMYKKKIRRFEDE